MTRIKNRSEKTEFVFSDCHYDPERASVSLEYRAGAHNFQEQFLIGSLSGKAPVFAEEYKTAIQNCLKGLHLAAGVSYYKALIPARLCSDALQLSAQSATFFNDFYRKGLAEFAWHHNLHTERWELFAADASISTKSAPQLQLQNRVLLPFGGGQGSAVSLEALRAIGTEPTLLMVNPHPAVERMAVATGAPVLRIERKIDPKIIQLNRQGARNGHVPITGILSFVFALAALIYDFDTIVLSNECSANEGNLPAPADGSPAPEINHQWSKSSEFETGFQGFLHRECSAHLNYFSLLRPCYELRVAELFSSPRFAAYRPLFLSCNRAFRSNGSATESWCGNCSKCRFVFMSLAGFLPRTELRHIFPVELAHPQQLEGFAQLLGLQQAKPFDCVGTVGESRAALRNWAAHPDWNGDPIVEKLLHWVEQDTDKQWPDPGHYLESGDETCLPPTYRGALHALARSCRA